MTKETPLDALLNELGSEADDQLATRCGREVRVRDDAGSEILDDLFRPESIAGEFGRARAAESGRTGEAGRRAFRRLARAYLERAGAEVDLEIRARLSEREPAGGFFFAVAAEPDPSRRAGIHRNWVEVEESLENLRHDRLDRRREAARHAGAHSVPEFLGASHPVPAAGILDAFERGAIAPLDEAVSRAAEERRRRCGAGGEASDVPGVRALADSRERLPEIRPVPLWESIARGLGEGAATGGFRAQASRTPHPAPRVFELASAGPVVVPGSWSGPAGLAWGLGAFGRALRASVVARARGRGDLLTGDGGFAVAAERLFARLPLSRGFLRWAGCGSDPEWVPDLRFEESVLPRLAWASLSIALRSGVDDEVFRRATSLSVTPELGVTAAECDPSGATILRGTAFAILLEDRLMSRHGSLWFLDRAAGRFLTDLWVAGTEETVESVARDLGLGTIEPTPILDACRPDPRVGRTRRGSWSEARQC